MKKFFTLLLITVLIISMMTGCREVAPPDGDTSLGEKDGTTGETLPKGEGIVKMGLGSVTSIDSSVEAEGDKGPAAQIDTTMAAVAFDRNDRVIKVTIDTAQTGVVFDNKGKLITDKKGEFKTKVELGNDYNMKRVSDIGREWFEQIAELEKWMIGKTVSEIRSMKVKQRDAEHTHIPDEPELTSTVTITVQDYIAAVVKSRTNAR